MIKKLNNNYTGEIDLHGIRHSEVERTMDCFLWDSMQKNKNEIKVITGSSDQMKLIVSNISKEYGMDYYVDPTNNGVVIIKMK